MQKNRWRQWVLFAMAAAVACGSTACEQEQRFKVPNTYRKMKKRTKRVYKPQGKIKIPKNLSLPLWSEMVDSGASSVFRSELVRLQGVRWSRESSGKIYDFYFRSKNHMAARTLSQIGNRLAFFVSRWFGRPFPGRIAVVLMPSSQPPKPKVQQARPKPPTARRPIARQPAPRPAAPAVRRPIARPAAPTPRVAPRRPAVRRTTPRPAVRPAQPALKRQALRPAPRPAARPTSRPSQARPTSQRVTKRPAQPAVKRKAARPAPRLAAPPKARPTARGAAPAARQAQPRPAPRPAVQPAARPAAPTRARPVPRPAARPGARALPRPKPRVAARAPARPAARPTAPQPRRTQPPKKATGLQPPQVGTHRIVIYTGTTHSPVFSRYGLISVLLSRTVRVFLTGRPEVDRRAFWRSVVIPAYFALRGTGAMVDLSYDKTAKPTLRNNLLQLGRPTAEETLRILKAYREGRLPAPLQKQARSVGMSMVGFLEDAYGRGALAAILREQVRRPKASLADSAAQVMGRPWRSLWSQWYHYYYVDLWRDVLRGHVPLRRIPLSPGATRPKPHRSKRP